MARPTLVSSTFPVVYVAFPERSSLEEIAEFNAQVEKLMQRGTFGCVTNLDRIGLDWDREHRAALASGSNQLMAQYPGRLVANAVVVTQILKRAIFIAFTAMQKSPAPTKIFAHTNDATLWVLQKLKEVGVEASLPFRPAPP